MRRTYSPQLKERKIFMATVLPQVRRKIRAMVEDDEIAVDFYHDAYESAPRGDFERKN